MARFRSIVTLVFFLAVIAAWVTHRGDAALGVSELIWALSESDEAGYAQMSARYREVYDLDEFRRGVARVVELRNANGVSSGPKISIFSRPTDSEYCGYLSGASNNTRGHIRARLVWEGVIGEWQVDALFWEERELDETRSAGDIHCAVTRR